MPQDTQRLEAVVKPRTPVRARIMVPAPRKPMPVITPAAIRDGSTAAWLLYISKT